MLPWIERIGMLSINPDAANRDDVARLASELLAIIDWAIKNNVKLPVEC